MPIHTHAYMPCSPGSGQGAQRGDLGRVHSGQGLHVHLHPAVSQGHAAQQAGGVQGLQVRVCAWTCGPASVLACVWMC